jgi:hypothetical protein
VSSATLKRHGISLQSQSLQSDHLLQNLYICVKNHYSRLHNMALSKVGPTPVVEETSSSPSATEVGTVVSIDGHSEAYVPNPAREKKLLLKVDLIMIPMLWWMCVLAYVDRNNIGNAKAAGQFSQRPVTTESSTDIWRTQA